MLIKLELSSDTDYDHVRYYFESNLIEIVDEETTEHGNLRLTIVADTKSKVLLVADLYFG